MGFGKYTGAAIRYGAGLLANQYLNSQLATPNQWSQFSQGRDSTELQVYKPLDTMLRSKFKYGSRTRTVVKRRRRKQRGGGSAGGILGPPIPRPGAFEKDSKYAKYGSHGEDETYGTISKPLISYIGMTSAKATGAGGEASTAASVSGSVVYHVAAALLRHILKKEFNDDIFRHDQQVGQSYAVPTKGDASSYTAPAIYFVYKDTPLGTADSTYGVGYVLQLTDAGFNAANANLLVKSFGYLAKELCQNVLISTTFGGVASSTNYTTRSLYGYFVEDRDFMQVVASGVNTPQLTQKYGSLRRLDNQYVRAYSIAELYLQNTTVADNTANTGTAAGSTNQDMTMRLDNRIDANPLDCVIMSFKNPYPRINNDIVVPTFTNHLYNENAASATVTAVRGSEKAYQLGYDTNADGVIVPNDAMTNNWVQLPKPDQFFGCTGYNKFKLAPGEMRKYVLKFKFDGSINKFIRGFATISDTDSSRYNGREALGTSVMFACEKIMSTGTDTNISINYQASFWAGAYMKKGKKPVMQALRSDGTYTGGADAAS